jgi:serine/threonine-protein kinase
MGAGGYELVSRLASGGMAEIFVARRRGLYAIEHTVVVKRLRDEVRGVPAVAKMFAWEAWISARLCHPNIVGFYDFVSHKGRDHLVLEHVRGPDLATIGRALAASGRSFPFRAVIDVGVAAARALQHAHGLADDEGRVIGLVHRDVSPQNILVSTNGEIKLIDFGVAKTTSSHVPRDTAPGLVKGKMGYIAPEHLRGQPLDARGDLYALGVVLFEMVTGRRLLRRGSDVEMIRAALDADIPSLSDLRSDCPPALEALVRRAMAQEPRDRFESAAVMEQALREIGAELTDERDAPTLTELAREVAYAQTEGRAGEPLSRGKRVAAASGPASGKAEEERAEENTRPEGAPRRARAARDPEVPASSVSPDAPTVSSDEPPAMTPPPCATTLESPAPFLPRRRIPVLRVLPILIAFVTGALVAALARGSLFHHAETRDAGVETAPAPSKGEPPREPGSEP